MGLYELFINKPGSSPVGPLAWGWELLSRFNSSLAQSLIKNMDTTSESPDRTGLRIWFKESIIYPCGCKPENRVSVGTSQKKSKQSWNKSFISLYHLSQLHANSPIFPISPAKLRCPLGPLILFPSKTSSSSSPKTPSGPLRPSGFPRPVRSAAVPAVPWRMCHSLHSGPLRPRVWRLRWPGRETMEASQPIYRWSKPRNLHGFRDFP